MNKITRQMLEMANSVLNNAYAPYSNFKVAACIHTQQGNFFTGVNVENASYGLTSCAESSAICTMVSHGETAIASMVLLASSNTLCAPCGACRQKIQEFSSKDTAIHLCNKSEILQSVTIEQLLPLAFEFKPTQRV